MLTDQQDIIEEFFYLIKINMQSFYKKGLLRTSTIVDYEDLEGIGYIGLVAAAKRVDRTLCKSAQIAYVSKFIFGHMVEELRKTGFFSRKTRKATREITKAQKNGHSSIKAISENTNLTEAEVEKYLLFVDYVFISIDDEDNYILKKLKSDNKNPREIVANKILSHLLYECILQLPNPRISLAFELYFFQGMTMKEISILFGVTLAAISFRIKNNLPKLRNICEKSGLSISDIPDSAMQILPKRFPKMVLNGAETTPIYIERIGSTGGASGLPPSDKTSTFY